MRLNSSTHWQLRLQHWLFLLLLGLVIALLAWLSIRYRIQADWTAGSRNTLSASSQALLARFEGPVRVTAYARENPALREGIQRLIERYQRVKPDLTLAFVNPDLLPDRVRALGITLNGELYVEYRGRGEKVQRLSEQALTAALQRLHLHQDRTVLFLEGHGERKPLGVANYDLGHFGQELSNVGITLGSVDLAKKSTALPRDALLVIAGPQRPLEAAELQRVLDYVAQGGNLLWLLEPGDLAGLQPLASLLGITVLPGMVIDPATSQLGIKNPAFIPVVDYGPHPITQTLRNPTLLPQSAALQITPMADWHSAILLASQPGAWAETTAVDQSSIKPNPDTTGSTEPLTVGLALSRPRPVMMTPEDSPTASEQRLVIIGDGDFLSNTYLGNGANLELGLNILNWLTLAEVPIIIRPKAVPDPNLALSEAVLAWIAVIFLIVIPVGFLISGWSIWFYRRRR